MYFPHAARHIILFAVCAALWALFHDQFTKMEL